MIINKLQFITNYLEIGFFVGFYCLLTYSKQITSCLQACSKILASCSIYNVILKFQKNDKKRHTCYIHHNNKPRKKIKLE
jgi:hypothetical protein